MHRNQLSRVGINTGGTFAENPVLPAGADEDDEGTSSREGILIFDWEAVVAVVFKSRSKPKSTETLSNRVFLFASTLVYILLTPLSSSDN